MGLFDFLKGQTTSSKAEPPIPNEEKRYYRPDSYYTNLSYPGTPFERRVITFQERKSVSYPSKRGLYVAEILLLEYCSYGTYPHPQTGYPGFWWFEYGIRNVGYYLSELERRGFICMDPRKGKYQLTQLGESELSENRYVATMHKEKNKTTEDAKFGPVFNVWEINRRMGKEKRCDWDNIIAEIKIEIQKDRSQRATEKEAFLKSEEKSNPAFVAGIHAMDKKLAAQDEQLSKIQKAEKRYAEDNDIGSLIAFWENIWANGGLLFNGSKWTFRLPDLYIKQKRYDDALKIVKQIKSPAYRDKAATYVEKIKNAKEKQRKKQSST